MAFISDCAFGIIAVTSGAIDAGAVKVMQRRAAHSLRKRAVCRGDCAAGIANDGNAAVAEFGKRCRIASGADGVSFRFALRDACAFLAAAGAVFRRRIARRFVADAERRFVCANIGFARKRRNTARIIDAAERAIFFGRNPCLRIAFLQRLAVAGARAFIALRRIGFRLGIRIGIRVGIGRRFIGAGVIFAAVRASFFDLRAGFGVAFYERISVVGTYILRAFFFVFDASAIFAAICAIFFGCFACFCVAFNADHSVFGANVLRARFLGRRRIGLRIAAASEAARQSNENE